MRCCAVNQFRNHTYSNSIVQAHLVDLWKLVPWLGCLDRGLAFMDAKKIYTALDDR